MHLLYGVPPAPWSSGAAVFQSGLPIGRRSQIRIQVAVACRLGSLSQKYLALLDTGAEWTVIGNQTADLLRSDLEDLEEEIRYATRHGILAGRLHRLPITLLADPGRGSDLQVESTIVVIREWPGPIVLGFRGLLEWIRFALDPSFDGRGTFFFGQPG
jgi:hypothetical protein